MTNTKVTIYDVAKKLGISTATVNRVLNNKPNVSEKMQKMVMNAVEQMGYRPSKTAAALNRAPINIRIVAAVINREFSTEILRGVNDTLRELEDFNFRGEVYTIGANWASKEYVDRVYQCADEGADGIILIGPPENNITKSIMEDIGRKGVKFCTVHSTIHTPCNLLSLQMNGRVAGGVAAELLELMLEPGSKVAVVTGSCSTTEHRASVEGFQSRCAAGPLVFSGVYEHNDDPELGAWVAEKIVRDTPDIGGVFLGTSNSVTFCRRLEELGYVGKVKIIASDIFPALTELMDRHVVQVSIYKSPIRAGKLAVRTMYNYLVEGKTPEKDVLLIDPQIAINSNISSFALKEEKNTEKQKIL